MLSPTILQEVETLVHQKVDAHEMFTAFDITLAVRRAVGRGTNVSHDDVKQEVHNLFDTQYMGSDYTRSLGSFPVPQGIPQPWVYHSCSDDPTTYGSGIPQLSGAAVTDSMAKAILYGSPNPTDSDDGANKTSDGTYKVDARGTLCIPSKLVRDLGLDIGDTAYVDADALAGTVVVSKAGGSLATYKVDAYGNVRLTQHALAQGGLGGTEYLVEGDTNAVTVKLSK